MCVLLWLQNSFLGGGKLGLENEATELMELQSRSYKNNGKCATGENNIAIYFLLVKKQKKMQLFSPRYLKKLHLLGFCFLRSYLVV